MAQDLHFLLVEKDHRRAVLIDLNQACVEVNFLQTQEVVPKTDIYSVFVESEVLEGEKVVYASDGFDEESGCFEGTTSRIQEDIIEAVSKTVQHLDHHEGRTYICSVLCQGESLHDMDF